MSRLHLNRDRQNLGQFPPEEVAAGLASGRFLPTDLAWREGMETWQPLAAITDLPVIAEVIPPADDPDATEIRPTSPGGTEPAWERRDEIGHARAAFDTVRQVITDPIATFRNMARTGGLLWPFLFFYVLQIACGLVGVLESLVWVRVLPASLVQHLGKDPVNAMTSGLIFSVPAMFLSGVIMPFVLSGTYYGAVRLLTKKETTFETIFRSYCYLAGAISALNLLPVPPIIFVQITFAVFLVVVVITYQVIALREAVGLTTPEAAMVVFLPILLCCFCLVAAGGVIGMAGALPALQNLGR